MGNVLIPDFQPLPTKFFRLRWRFEYSDGKAPKNGVWDNATQKESDSAWAANKTNLLYAIIEAEDRQTCQLLRRVVVEGQDYASMQWEAYAKTPGFFKGAGEFKLRQHLAGLSILTRSEKITCWVNGSVERAPLSEHDKTWAIREHSV